MKKTTVLGLAMFVLTYAGCRAPVKNWSVINTCNNTCTAGYTKAEAKAEAERYSHNGVGCHTAIATDKAKQYCP